MVVLLEAPLSVPCSQKVDVRPHFFPPPKEVHHQSTLSRTADSCRPPRRPWFGLEVAATSHVDGTGVYPLLQRFQGAFLTLARTSTAAIDEAADRTRGKRPSVLKIRPQVYLAIWVA